MHIRRRWEAVGVGGRWREITYLPEEDVGIEAVADHADPPTVAPILIDNVVDHQRARLADLHAHGEMKGDEGR